MKLFVQKTIRLAMVILFIATGVLVKNVAQAQNKFILSTTEFTIKTGHASQFEEGIKAWKDCYLENKGEWTWTLWKRYNGKGSAYVLTSNMPNWAELDDENDEAGKKCRQIAIEKIIPHIESAEDNFATSMPEISKKGATVWNVIWVTFFRVENSTIFNATVKEISDIMEKTEGDKRGYWYSTSGGGPDSPDYYVTTPFKNFAELDIERDGVWKMVEKNKGKEATEKMRNEFRSAVSNSWSYIYKRMGDLSNDQPK
ncbi:MAG TPA: hypothetical protein PLC80_09625 [Draconibacterium sp.]|nr:hypothetical protein [Draconibacterium sp.]